jgi:hypothetical protein
MLEEDCLKLMKQNINGRFSQGFGMSMVVLKIVPGAAKFCDRRTFSHIAHTAKIVARILWSRFERKFEGVFGEDQFGFR